MSIIPNLQQFVVVRLSGLQSTGGCFGGFAKNLLAVGFFIPNSYKSLCVCLCVSHVDNNFCMKINSDVLNA